MTARFYTWEATVEYFSVNTETGAQIDYGV